MFGPRFFGNNRAAREMTGGDWRTERTLVPWGGENRHTSHRIEVCVLGAAFRRRAAPIGGEDRQQCLRAWRKGLSRDRIEHRTSALYTSTSGLVSNLTDIPLQAAERACPRV
jgi:hypothetical protein